MQWAGAEAQSKAMLSPQFSLRRLLLFVTVCAVLCLVPAVAAQGYLWALAFATGLAGALALLAVQSALYLLTCATGTLLALVRNRRARV